MIIKQENGFQEGYNAITCLDDSYKTLMDFGVLVLKKGRTYTDNEKKEKAYLLIKGSVIFEWGNNKAEANRGSFLDENPCCLHVPSDVEIKVTSTSDDTEISITRSDNRKSFQAKFYSRDECMSVEGGKGQLGETSLRIIRTIFDLSNAPDSNLVLGEVVHMPGRWSSYPPHHHPQPELYLYKFMPEQGFGYSEIGDNVYKVKNNDTSVITSGDHPQVCAPGYAMYYIWAIRHLENNPFNERIYSDEHRWLLGKDVKIWPEK